MPASLLFLILSVGIYRVDGSIGCYTPNGTERNSLINAQPGYLYIPCNSLTSHSMCCAIGPGQTSTPDICLPNGLCKNTNADLGIDVWWRESCTDPTWQDPNCIKLFLNGSGYPGTGPGLGLDGANLTDVYVTPCRDNVTYCAGATNWDCCQNGDGVYLVNGVQTSKSPSPTLPTQTSNSAAAASSTQQSSTESQNKSSGLSTGAKVGIAVPVALVGIFAIAAAAWCMRRRSKKREQANVSLLNQEEKLSEMPELHDAGRAELEVHGNKKVENIRPKAINSVPVEMNS